MVTSPFITGSVCKNLDDEAICSVMTTYNIYYTRFTHEPLKIFRSFAPALNFQIFIDIDLDYRSTFPPVLKFRVQGAQFIML